MMRSGGVIRDFGKFWQLRKRHVMRLMKDKGCKRGDGMHWDGLRRRKGREKFYVHLASIYRNNCLV